MPKLPSVAPIATNLWPLTAKPSQVPNKLPSTTGVQNDGGWDLREVATDFLLGELVRRGMAITIRPRSEAMAEEPKPKSGKRK